MYEVLLKPSVVKQLDQLQARPRRLILEALEALSGDPRPRGCVKLHGRDDLWRIRVGQYRVVYTIEEEVLTVLVVRVAHRKDAYRP